MSLDHRNPLHWGKSPLTDRALMLEQIQAESAEESAEVIDPEFDEVVGVWRGNEYTPCPPTGEENS